jgi:hypothetical protein
MREELLSEPRQQFWGLTRYGFPDSGNCQFVSQVAMRCCPDVGLLLVGIESGHREGGLASTLLNRSMRQHQLNMNTPHRISR